MTESIELERAVLHLNCRGWFICQLRQSHPEGGSLGEPLKWIVVLSDGKYLSAWGEAASIAQALRAAEADIDIVLAREVAYTERASAPPKAGAAGQTPPTCIPTSDLFAALGLKGPQRS